MDLISVLKSGIGKKAALKLSKIHIHMHSDQYSSFGDFYICFYEKVNSGAFYFIKKKSIDFEDNIYPLIDGKPDLKSKGDLSYEVYHKYTITVEEIDKEKYDKIPVSISNSFFELIEIDVFKKKIGNMKQHYEELNKPIDFSPELYFLKFAKEDEIVIYFDLHMNLIHIYNKKIDFLNDISRRGISLNDFEQITI